MMPSGNRPIDGSPPRCTGCGFDLTGLFAADDETAQCPECGRSVTVEQAFGTATNRLAAWLQEPAEPSPARTVLAVVVVIIASTTALAAVLAIVYLIWTAVRSRL